MNKKIETEVFEHQLIRVLSQFDGGLQAKQIYNELINRRDQYISGKTEEAAIKSIRRKLTTMHECSSFHPKYDAHLGITDYGINIINDGKQTLYIHSAKGPARFSDEDYDAIGVALSNLLTDRYFRFAMPPDVYDKWGVDVHEKSQANPAALELIKLIHVKSRGQDLQCEDEVAREVLGDIYQSLLDKKQLSIQYEKIKILNGKKQITNKPYTLYPIGIIYREPKLSLMAVDVADPNELVKEYIVQNIKSTTSLEKDIPQGLKKMSSWLKEQKPPCPEKFKDRDYTVVLEILSQGNIIRDLLTFKLNLHQEERPKLNGNLEITLRKQAITHDLINWIMARSTQVKVIQPLGLKRYIQELHKNSLKLYE